MVIVSGDEMRDFMAHPKNIRNVTVFGPTGHGKSTLLQSLVSSAGITVENCGRQMVCNDSSSGEHDGCTMTQSILYPTAFDLDKKYSECSESDKQIEADGEEEKLNRFLISFIDSPGHVEFSAEVTAALRLTDGAIVVVDCVSGASTHTETLLRQAVNERIRPVLFLNKMDRALFELKLGKEDLYLVLKQTIENINVVLETYGEEDGPMGPITADPSLGNVAFGSALHGWAFTLEQFAEFYAEKLNVPVKTLTKYLWGDHFFDEVTSQWSSSKQPGLIRGFCYFVLDPIYKMFEATMNVKTANEVEVLAEKLGVELSAEEMKLEGEPLMKAFLSRWLPAGDAILQMACIHLPSPVTAQNYRTEMLYGGPQDDQAALAMKICDPNGPLMMYVSKMVPTNENGRFNALGRVFSGKITPGMSVRIQGPNYIHGSTCALIEAAVEGCVTGLGDGLLPLDEIPCGNLALLIGVDQHITKSATITTFPEAHKMRGMKFAVSPIVFVDVEPANAEDLPQMVESLKLLDKSDPLVKCTFEESGEYSVGCSGELHLEKCLETLEKKYAAGISLKKSNPRVAYRETISAPSSQMCMAKSPHKRNRFYCTATPLSDELSDAIEKGKVPTWHNVEKTLRERYAFDADDARNVWCFGPDMTGPNILLDSTKGLSPYLNEVKDCIIYGFSSWATLEGVLCEERMHGIRFDLHDAKMPCDSFRRGRGGQIIPAIRRVVYAAFLTAQPRLLEPVYAIEIQTPEEWSEGVRGVLNRRQAHVYEESRVGVTSMMLCVKAHIPVVKSFGLAADLHSSTKGQASVECVFDHWELVPGDPLEPGTPANQIVRETRLRRGLKENVPDLDFYLDRW